MFKTLRNLSLVALSSIFILGCSDKDKDLKSQSSNGLTIISGSEIQAIQPLLDQASKELGFPISFKFTGTIDSLKR